MIKTSVSSFAISRAAQRSRTLSNQHWQKGDDPKVPLRDRKS
ncbi:MAG TPA: hypothetical protein V6D37_17120 [Candidatus Sericytochromatia bacterium]